MYQIGDQVVYGFHGVCRVMQEEVRLLDGKQVVYLVLEPIGQEGTRYLIPTHNAAAMGRLRHMLRREELEALLHSDGLCEAEWIGDENLRKNTYRELIGSGDVGQLVRMMATLYRHKKQQLSNGRKVHLCDDNFLRDAEKLLTSEAAVVLGLSPEEARTYLRTSIGKEYITR